MPRANRAGEQEGRAASAAPHRAEMMHLDLFLATPLVRRLGPRLLRTHFATAFTPIFIAHLFVAARVFYSGELDAGFPPATATVHKRATTLLPCR